MCKIDFNGKFGLKIDAIENLNESLTAEIKYKALKRVFNFIESSWHVVSIRLVIVY